MKNQIVIMQTIFILVDCDVFVSVLQSTFKKSEIYYIFTRFKF